MIVELIDLVAYGVFIAVATILLVSNIKLRAKKKLLANDLLQQTLDKMALLQHIEKLTAEANSKEIEQTDGFLKFVSDSRDWAFQYIESVQEALEAFDKKITPTLEYYSTYGTAIEGLHNSLTTEILDAYNELKKVLPQEKV